MSKRPEAVSFLGKQLFAHSVRAGVDASALDSKVAEAEKALEVSDSPASRAALVDALRGAGKYRMAVARATVGLAKWPDDALLLTERGHTYVNMRAVTAALADLSKAVRLAPHSFDAWYHYALSLWFSTSFAEAAEAFDKAAEVTKSDSSRLAAQTWQYTALRRSGNEPLARALLPTIRWDVDLEGKNLNYQLRARFYQGGLTEQDLVNSQAPGTKSEGSLSFGLGIWHLANGNVETARRHFEVGAASEFWPAFGVAACELELAILDGLELPEPETTGVLGDPLYALVSHGEQAAELSTKVATALAAHKADPDDVDKIRVYAKALASGLACYRAANAVLEAALERFPDHPLLLCDRGHYFVNMRQFDLAKADLERAKVLAPESSDVWYHLALSHWMLGEFADALSAFQRALALADNESHTVAYTDWVYLALRRVGKHAEAQAAIEPIHKDMATTMNNHLYLKRLLFYKGEWTEAQLVEVFEQGGLAFAAYYGLACWHLYEGNASRAREYFFKVVDNGTAWGGFAHVASETELARGLL